MAAPVYYTAEMVRALPADGNRYETVWGELLVTPAPRPLHQIVLLRLLREIDAFVERHRCGQLLTSPADISWSPDVLVQPDLFVVDRDEARTLDWARMQSLKLVVEILSPSTARYDRFTKRRLYQEAGVPLYWIVDVERECVEVWTPGATTPAVETDRVTWRPDGTDDSLTIELARVFREV